METYIVQVIDNNSHKITKEVIVNSKNADNLRKRIIREHLNKNVVLSIYKVLKDRPAFMGSMWSIGNNIEYRAYRKDHVGAYNADFHLVNPKNGKLDEIGWRD